LELEAKIGSFPKKEIFSVRTEELELELGFKKYGFFGDFHGLLFTLNKSLQLLSRVNKNRGGHMKSTNTAVYMVVLRFFILC
jgi:hypothetical protein